MGGFEEKFVNASSRVGNEARRLRVAAASGLGGMSAGRKPLCGNTMGSNAVMPAKSSGFFTAAMSSVAPPME